MQNWFQRGVLLLISLGAGFPAIAPAADLWTGVVVIADGSVKGNWKPAAVQPSAPEEWIRWEQMEKMNGSEQLRRSSPPNAIMMPDGFGRSVLAVAPHAGMAGYVVDAGAGMVDLRGAAVENCMVRLAQGGQLMVRDSLLSTFHVAESAGASPGGTVVIERCAVTGPFGGTFWGGSQRWVVRNCHFRDSRLPWVNQRPGQEPVVERCHFEKCFIPESFLLRCQDCTFDGCVVGSPESFAAGRGKALVLTETGSANQWLGRPAGMPGVSVTKGNPAYRFWSEWTGAPEGSPLDSRMASLRPVVPQLLSEGADHMEAAVFAAGLKGKVYRRLDAGERLQFDEASVKVMEWGENRAPGVVLSRAGRKLEWAQTVREFDTENGFGRMMQAGGMLNRKGVFSRDFSLLAIIEEVPGSAPDPVRIFRTLPEDTAMLREPVSQLAGTTWALEGPEKMRVRFETPTQLIWLDEGTAKRGGSLWCPLRGDQQLVIADWPGGPAQGLLEPGLRALQVTNAAGKVWQGKLLRRDLPGDFSALLPAGTAVVAAVADGPAEPGAPPENPFAPEPEKTTQNQPVPAQVPPTDPLKSRTSRVNGLLVAVLEGGKTAGATSLMNAVAVPAAAGSETTLNFNQKIGPMMEQALQEVRKFHTIRQGKWPAGFQIEISFADKYTPKDGPSAAVACALLLEGLFTGTVWDGSMAVTGDLNADGSVQPVGGVPAKIRGAVGRKCRIVGIPAGNERAVRDFVLSDGPQSLLAIHVFSLKEFDQARELALVDKLPGLATAIAAYDRVIQAAPATREKAGAWLKQAAVAAQLRKVVQAAPHHLSAKLLLEMAESRSPAFLSLAGSIEAVDRECFDVLEAIRSSKATRNFSGIREDKLGDAISRLRRLRSILHPDTRPLLDSMESFSVMIRTFLANPPRTPAFINKGIEGIRAAGETVDRQYRALRNNPEVMAELMKE